MSNLISNEKDSSISPQISKHLNQTENEKNIFVKIVCVFYLPIKIKIALTAFYTRML